MRPETDVEKSDGDGSSLPTTAGFSPVPGDSESPAVLPTCFIEHVQVGLRPSVFSLCSLCFVVAAVRRVRCAMALRTENYELITLRKASSAR